MAGPRSSGCRRSGSGQAAQLHEGSWHAMSHRQRAHVFPAVRVPRKVSSAKWAVKEEPKSSSARLSPKPAPAKVETKPEKAAAKDKSSDPKECKLKGKGQRGNRPTGLTKKLNTHLQKMEKLKMRRVQPLMEQEGKKPKCN